MLKFVPYFKPFFLSLISSHYYPSLPFPSFCSTSFQTSPPSPRILSYSSLPQARFLSLSPLISTPICHLPFPSSRPAPLLASISSLPPLVPCLHFLPHTKIFPSCPHFIIFLFLLCFQCTGSCAEYICNLGTLS